MDKKSGLKHIAIIMDGNRRWAKSHGLPVLEGHRRVASDILEPLIERAAERGIEYVTLWAFSTENWRREPAEVRGIMSIFRNAILTFGERMHKKGIRIRVIGNISRFDQDIQTSIENLVKRTKNNTRITVVFALNYGGRDEIMRAIQKFKSTQSDTKKGETSITQFSEALDTAGIPDPEFIVRTGGEQRLSGFLLWQSEYSELHFPSWYMPEFTPEKLEEVLTEYEVRKRRFGK